MTPGRLLILTAASCGSLLAPALASAANLRSNLDTSGRTAFTYTKGRWYLSGSALAG